MNQSPVDEILRKPSPRLVNEPWHNGPPPHGQLVEVEDRNGRILKVMTYPGLEGSRPYWLTENGRFQFSENYFLRWREIEYSWPPSWTEWKPTPEPAKPDKSLRCSTVIQHTLDVVMNNWPQGDIEPNFVDVISALRGWKPLQADTAMTVSFGEARYHIHRVYKSQS